MNQALLMLIRDESDITPCMSGVAALEFSAIKEAISTERPNTVLVRLDAAKKGAVDADVKPNTEQPQNLFPTELLQSPRELPVPPKEPPAQPPPPPVPAAPPVPTKLQELNSALDGLLAHLKDLASQLNLSTTAFQNVKAQFSGQLLEISWLDDKQRVAPDGSDSSAGKAKASADGSRKVFRLDL